MSSGSHCVHNIISHKKLLSIKPKNGALNILRLLYSKAHVIQFIIIGIIIIMKAKNTSYQLKMYYDNRSFKRKSFEV